MIRLDFAGGVVQSPEGRDEMIRQLLVFNQRRLGIHCEATSIAGCFAELIIRAHEAGGGRVVVLVDEYDKPILDSIEHPQRIAVLREGLKNLYSTMKTQDAHIQFVFMTGVTEFSKVSLFSGLNQFDIKRIDPVTLLFQTGYLTIDQARQAFDQWLFKLRVPNQEVRQALANHLVGASRNADNALKHFGGLGALA